MDFRVGLIIGYMLNHILVHLNSDNTTCLTCLNLFQVEVKSGLVTILLGPISSSCDLWLGIVQVWTLDKQVKDRYYINAKLNSVSYRRLSELMSLSSHLIVCDNRVQQVMSIFFTTLMAIYIVPKSNF